MEREITRREALATAGAVATAAALTPYLRVPIAPAQAAAAAQAAGDFALPLRRMPELTKSRLSIPIVARDVPIARGERTLMWTFDGTFPGPTIRRPAGSTTRVRFRHRIPQAGTLTIHNHGHHSKAIHDGQPMSQLIAPGSGREYVYRHVEEGRPLRGGMRWYHDHSHGRTNLNAWMGLLGLFIVEDPLERKLRLPAGDQELLLVVTTRTLDENNQLVDPFSAAPDPGADAVGSGTLMLVNGVPRPYTVVEPTTYRLRILNAASFSPYNLGFADGVPVTQIGNESGLFPEPAERERVLMGPAERCDLLVDFSGFAGRNVVLSSTPQEATGPQASLVAPASAPAEDIMQFRVLPKRVKKITTRRPRPLPAKLRALPEWVAALSTSPDRTFAFGQAVESGSGRTVWTINGSPYDPERIEARPELGSTETWMLVNSSQQSHYIHLHAVDWKVISRNGGTPAPDEDVLKETFRLDPGETLAVGAKFTDHTGRYLIHCHMLSHEDHAMMTTFEIVPPGSGDRTARRSPAVTEAVIRDQRVFVPLDTLTPAEMERTRAMLAAQARIPGRPAPAPTTPLPLEADSAAGYLCRLPGAEVRS
jgi:FtsP/CotA-like multicopper oxidase with cupredoxin domain